MAPLHHNLSGKQDFSCALRKRKYTPLNVKLDSSVAKLEKEAIEAALKRNSGHIAKSARALEIPYARLYHRLYKYQLWKFVYELRQKAA